MILSCGDSPRILPVVRFVQSFSSIILLVGSGRYFIDASLILRPDLPEPEWKAI